jgi:parvulin-like peptidyl-prolyl isomerase
MTKKDNSLSNEEEVQSEHHPKKIKKYKKIIIGIIILIVVVIVAILVWLYTGQVSNAKKKVFSNVPLPVAVVEISPISSTKLFQREKLIQQILKSANQPSTNITDQILDQLIESEKIEILASKNHLSVNSGDIDIAYKSILNQFPGANEEELKKALQQNYGLDLHTFKNEALRQVVLQDKLSKWFNEQESLNSEPYKRARDIIKELDNGADFEELANKYNQDASSQDFAGDNGFVALSDLLPEFQDPIKDLAIGDKKLIASRYGLHSVKVLAIEEKDVDGKKVKNYNLRQIFIKPNDFIKWFTDQSSKIRSFKLI